MHSPWDESGTGRCCRLKGLAGERPGRAASGRLWVEKQGRAQGQGCLKEGSKRRSRKQSTCTLQKKRRCLLPDPRPSQRRWPPTQCGHAKACKTGQLRRRFTSLRENPGGSWQTNWVHLKKGQRRWGRATLGEQRPRKRFRRFKASSKMPVGVHRPSYTSPCWRAKGRWPRGERRKRRRRQLWNKRGRTRRRFWRQKGKQKLGSEHAPREKKYQAQGRASPVPACGGSHGGGGRAQGSGGKNVLRGDKACVGPGPVREGGL